MLDSASRASPDNPLIHLRRAESALDRYDFAAAAAAFETVLRLDPDMTGVRPRLASCLNALGRHEDSLAALAVQSAPAHQRAAALLALGRDEEAEVEYWAALAAWPGDREALRGLGKRLRRTGRSAELAALCEALSAQGVGHAQLFYSWGTALALCGDAQRAQALLFDPRRVAVTPLPLPPGFTEPAAFNAALAEEILSNPHRLSDFAGAEQANRGSSRIHALFAGRRPALVRDLLAMLQRAIGEHRPARLGAFDPWLDARPSAAHLHPWGLIQRGSDYEEWHLHRSGWLSGVYYVRVPKGVTTEGKGPGCIEFGPPMALARAMPGYLATWRHAPREGFLLLAPSHYPHRTIPTGSDEHRISFAFDVVPTE